jgi:hypothetical protein
MVKNQHYASMKSATLLSRSVVLSDWHSDRVARAIQVLKNQPW